MAENLYETFELLLCTLEENKLVEFCIELGLDKSLYENQIKRKLFQAIREFVDKGIDKSSEEENILNLTSWLSFLRQGEVPSQRETENVGGKTPPETDEIGGERPEETEKEGELSELKKQFSAILEEQRKEVARVLGGFHRGSPPEQKEMNCPTPPTHEFAPDPRQMSSLLRRELKIHGQIGEQGKTDQISFVSLSRQIDSAVEKGYSQSEIVEAIIKAMKPGLQLRSYIETLKGLTLPRLRQILRSHYKEKSGTQLYQELVTIAQEQKETPEAFLLRALDLRQKVIFASQEADANFQYDIQLIQGAFLRSMETGLRDDNILTKFRPFLQQKGIPDEELIQQMGWIASAEAERQAKIGRFKKPREIQANPILEGAEAAKPQQLEKTKMQSKSIGAELLTTLEKMQSQLNALETKVDSYQRKDYSQAEQQTKQSYRPNNRGYASRNTGQTFACENCKKSGKDHDCRHCNYCGGENHFSRDCFKRTADYQGNERGLRRGDKA